MPNDQWPESAPYNAAIDAFDAALSRAAWDKTFRDRLTASPASAKEAVAEIAEINIPEDRIIVFYEPQEARVSTLREARETTAAVGGETGVAQDTINLSHSSENVHVFYLPPFKQDDTSEKYVYEDYFMCCYDQWRRE